MEPISLPENLNALLCEFKRALTKLSHSENKSEENGIDPDDGNSWKCSGCSLPIFSTPFMMKHGRFFHDRCANPPQILNNHVLHFMPLYLKENWGDSSSQEYSCDKCSSKCGSFYYQCSHGFCNFRLDLLCSKQVEILHRSHEHRLMVVRGSASFVCGACGTQHPGLSAPSFFCSACDFWIHKDCASSPNAVRLLGTKKHRHSLFLAYNVAATSEGCTCEVCGERLLSLGAYVCLKCRYYVHIRCATSDPRSFEPVLIRDAKLADLLHLPMADERSSVVGYMLENTSAGDEDDHDETEKIGDNNDDEWEISHKHPLIIHEEEDDDDDDDDDNDGTEHSTRACNACAQLISPPFYTCSKCPDFLLHSSCAKLPTKIKHPFHQQHTLFLSTKPPKYRLDKGFNCKGCDLLCNGFSYRCKTCHYFTMDVICALMPPSITHQTHGKTHILYLSPSHQADIFGQSIYKCSCCGDELGRLYYECTNCRHLKLHARCALLPTTLTHKFDKHPLKLITSSKVPLITYDEDYYVNEVDDDDDDDDEEGRLEICEVCEKDIKEKLWYYSCKECEMSLHVNCIPLLDILSRVKFGIRVDFKFHDCPLTLVPENSIAGHFCDDCNDKFEYDNYFPSCSYECSKCNYRIHAYCTISKLNERDRS